MPGLLERLQRALEVVVEVFDLEAVIENLAADFRRVGQEPGQAGVGEFLAGPAPCADVPRSMGFPCAQPEEERLVVVALRQKLLEVQGVVGRVEAGAALRFGQHAGVVFTEGFGFPAILEPSGTTGLSGGAEFVAGILEQQREERELAAQNAPKDAAIFDFIGVAPGQQRVARRRAGRSGGVSVMEQRAFAGDAVEGGRSSRGIAVGADMHRRLVVRDDEKDIRAVGLGEGRRCGKQQGERQVAHRDHYGAAARVGVYASNFC